MTPFLHPYFRPSASNDLAANDHPLRTLGVARMADNECAILVCFNRAPSDDELRTLHDALRQEPKS